MFTTAPASWIDPSMVTTSELTLPELTNAGIRVTALRLDKIHPVVSGNKGFKLKEHLTLAVRQHAPLVITFGGAWSNHIVATACAAAHLGLASMGIIRGERSDELSDTLQTAKQYGMRLEFISRDEYKAKDNPVFLDHLRSLHPDAYVIPEGGAGWAGIRGSGDILLLTDTSVYTHILCAIGTGTMFMGLARTAARHQQVIGIPVLNTAEDLLESFRPWIQDPEKWARCRLIKDYHFGGYAKKTESLLAFMRQLYATQGIPTDFVYTGKLFYAVIDQARQGFFPPASHILIIHSGGLQGNRSLAPEVLGF